jgi:AcrR family transcriptional regulator
MGRTYNSPRRREQAAATRAQILASAQRLFERDGYAATSMAAVAEAAGVSLKTVYVVFETKSGLLRAVWHRVLRGAGDGVPVGEQPWFRRVLDEPDPRTQLKLNAQNSREVKQRAGPIMVVIQAAAPGDAEIRALWQRIQTEFHANQREVVVSLHGKRALR